VLAILKRRRDRLGSKISVYGQLAEVAVYFDMSGLARPLAGHDDLDDAFARKEERAVSLMSLERLVGGLTPL
jgi:hypothetical protein